LIIDKASFENLFKINLSEEDGNYIQKNSLLYDYLHQEEIDSHILKILKFLNEDIVPSGKIRKPLWNNGWNENYIEFIKHDLDIDYLLPQYYRRGKAIMRYNGKFIYPHDDLFEAKFLSVIQYILAKYYLVSFDDIYELGAGPCHNIAAFSKFLKKKNFYVTDWVEPTLKICKTIEANKEKLGFSTHKYNGNLLNFFELDPNYKIKNNSIVITFGSLEQIGGDFKNALDFFLSLSNVTFLHIEPILELYNNTLFDQLALKYSQKRGYLEGYFKSLKDLESKKEISINFTSKLLGSAFHDGWTMVIWKKNV
jgi:hypothetical protein